MRSISSSLSCSDKACYHSCARILTSVSASLLGTCMWKGSWGRVCLEFGLINCCGWGWVRWYSAAPSEAQAAGAVSPEASLDLSRHSARLELPNPLKSIPTPGTVPRPEANGVEGSESLAAPRPIPSTSVTFPSPDLPTSEGCAEKIPIARSYSSVSVPLPDLGAVDVERSLFASFSSSLPLGPLSSSPFKCSGRMGGLEAFRCTLLENSPRVFILPLSSCCRVHAGWKCRAQCYFGTVLTVNHFLTQREAPLSLTSRRCAPGSPQNFCLNPKRRIPRANRHQILPSSIYSV